MKRHRFAVCGILAVALSIPPSGLAADDPPRSAMDIVPADAAFFASWSQQGEQLDRLCESKAFSEFMEIPQVRQVLGPLLLGEFDEDNPNHVTMKQWLSQPFVQVGLDAISHEVFVYGDVSFTEVVRQSQDMAASVHRVRLQALAAGKTAEEADVEAGRAAVDQLDTVRVPSMVFGFKVEDRLRAQSQLMLLDMMIRLRLASKDVPPSIRKGYGRETVQGQQFLRFKLDGSMLPVGQITFEADADPEIVAALKAAIRNLEISVVVGLLGDYAILSIGNSTEHLQRIGQGESLSGHSDLARVVEPSGRHLTSVYYVASDYRNAIAAVPGQVAELAELIRGSAESDENLSEETRAKVKEALAALEKERSAARVHRAPLVGYSYLTEDGYEGFRYGEAAPTLQFDGPMSILLHVGADPIAVSARRGWIGSVDDYLRFSDQLASGISQLEQAIDTGDDEEMRYFWYRLCDLARQLDTIMREQIVPALAGGQAATVISATDRARQWHAEMPAADEPLPLPELGLVVETNDPLGLLEGVEDAYEVVSEAVRLVSDAAKEIPPLEPEIEDTAMGRLYYLPMWPELTRIDPDLLAPTAGLSDRWLVLTLRPKTATALLRPTGWIPSGIAAGDQGHLTSLTHVRPEGLVQIVLDWMGYVEQTTMEDPSEEDAAILAVYRSALQLVACLKSYTRSVRREGDASVTHTVWRFEDLP